MIKNPLRFYVYAYLRSKDSKTAKAGTPYYIGKGQGNRILENHKHIHIPTNRRNIVFLETNLSELGAFAIERRYISWYGRKNLNGILLNNTEGGPGTEGYNHTHKTKSKIYNSRKNNGSNWHTEEVIEKIKTSNLGKKRSIETKEKCSNSQIGNKNALGSKRTEEQIMDNRQARIGKKLSEETKKKLRGPRGPGKMITCPHCNSIGRSSNMVRWHYDNCKLNQN